MPNRESVLGGKQDALIGLMFGTVCIYICNFAKPCSTEKVGPVPESVLNGEQDAIQCAMFGFCLWL